MPLVGASKRLHNKLKNTIRMHDQLNNIDCNKISLFHRLYKVVLGVLMSVCPEDLKKRGFKIATEPYTMLLIGTFSGSLLFMGFFSIGLHGFYPTGLQILMYSSQRSLRT